MTTDELAQKIKAKYPDYANVPNQELVQKIVAKYPQYGSQIDKPQTVLGAVGAAMGSRPELQPYTASIPSLPNPQNPIRGALRIAGQTLAAPIRTGATLNTPVDPSANGMANVLGGKVTEAGARLGYPNTGLALGIGLSAAPKIALGAGAIRGLMTSDSPMMRGIREPTSSIGKQMQVGEEEVGLTKDLPVRRGTIPRWVKGAENSVVAPESYPKDTNTFLNFARNRLAKYGDMLSPEELGDYKKIFPEMFNKGEVVAGTPQHAIASQLARESTELFNKAVPGREELNQVYSWAKKFQPDLATPLVNFIKRYGKLVLAEALGIGAGVGAGKVFK